MAASLRRPSAAATVMGTSSRRRWCHTVVACEEETMKRSFDKQARVEVTLSLEGFEASELKAILPLVHQRLGVAEARQAVYNQMASISQA
ncbi:hypothetical protein HanRHA438_Chr01g0012761 [Helianthus annuus]|nr:hypothetical protein HanRHA438_Chr01g0012761 [Helianthus annuus]